MNEKNLAAAIAAEAEASELAYEAEQRGEPPRRTDSTVTRGNSRGRVLQVRLNEGEYAELEMRAERVGVPVSTFARSILLGHDSPDIGRTVEDALRHALKPELLRAN